MNGSYQTAREKEALLENFTAKLTETAYQVALRHGVGGPWVDLELDLWQQLRNTVRQWGHELPKC